MATDAHKVAAAAILVRRRTTRLCELRHTQISRAPIAAGITISQGPRINKTVEPSGDRYGRPKTCAPSRTRTHAPKMTIAATRPTVCKVLTGVGQRDRLFAEMSLKVKLGIHVSSRQRPMAPRHGAHGKIPGSRDEQSRGKAGEDVVREARKDYRVARVDVLEIGQIEYRWRFLLYRLSAQNRCEVRGITAGIGGKRTLRGIIHTRKFLIFRGFFPVGNLPFRASVGSNGCLSSIAAGTL